MSSTFWFMTIFGSAGTSCIFQFQFQYLDVVSVNRYQGWYINPGDSKAVSPEVHKEILGWRKTYNKPILITEYGADAIEGIHYVRK